MLNEETMNIKRSAEKSALILQAFLDMFQHPVWITDSDGNLLMNEQAQTLVAQGFNPRDAAKTPHEVVVKGEPFRLDKREMNHGTGCLLHELRASDKDYFQRLRDSTGRLSAMLEARGQASM